MSGPFDALQGGERDPLLGALVDGRYRIKRQLGAGGMGRVYEAEHEGIRRGVALKVLHAQYASDPDVAARFTREAWAPNSIASDHVVEVTDKGRLPDGAMFLVLELLRGRDLLQAIKREGPFDVARAAHIAAQLCEALGAAHRRGIVHRDLKPANVFLVHRGGDPDFVKVLDFGIAKFKTGEPAPSTATGTMIGTPHYMAPEQMRGEKSVDHRADLYALGVILFQMVTARLPFEAESIHMLIVDVCQKPSPAARSYRAGLPPDFDALIARLLAKDPAARLADAAAVRSALAPWARAARDAEHPQRLALDLTAPAPATPPVEERPTLDGTPPPTVTGSGKEVVADPSRSAVDSAASPSRRALVPLAVLVGAGLLAVVSRSSPRVPSAPTRPEAASVPSAPELHAPAATPALEDGRIGRASLDAAQPLVVTHPAAPAPRAVAQQTTLPARTPVRRTTAAVDAAAPAHLPEPTAEPVAPPARAVEPRPIAPAAPTPTTRTTLGEQF